MYVSRLIAVAFCFCCASVSAMAAESPAQKMPISREEATRIALSRVPGGTIESAKLEVEGKNTLWSVDVKMPRSKNITEVHIEAHTGKVISVQIETPGQQAAEAIADKRNQK